MGDVEAYGRFLKRTKVGADSVTVIATANLAREKSSVDGLKSRTYSFRDPMSRVTVEGDVTRRFTVAASEAMQTFLDSACHAELVARKLVDPPTDVTLDSNGELVLTHRPIATWSYPYEWSYSMLRDAALAHLEVLEVCADHGYGLSDATSFNVTFVDGRPLFVDYGSFIERHDNEPWWAYTEFCEHFLFPLLVSAYTGTDLQMLLRGGFGRVTTANAFGFLKRHPHRRAVLRQVLIPHLAATRTDPSVDDVAAATESSMTAEIYRNMLASLRTVISKAERRETPTTWSDYSDRSHYEDAALAAKADFVVAAAELPNVSTVLDVGTNDGYFAQRVASLVANVVAMDGDAAVIDALYRSLRSRSVDNILPLVIDAANPSPPLGWRSQERTSLMTRVKPDLVLSLAVLHHLCLSSNIPLDQIVDWLEEFDAFHVVEFVHRDDPMVEHLLSRKTSPEHFDYSLSTFLELIERPFTITKIEQLPGGTRTMLLLEPKH